MTFAQRSRKWRAALTAMQLCLLGACLAIPIAAVGADNLRGTEYQIKAAFLYKFCLYVTWPDGLFQAPTDPLVMGIAAPQPFVDLVTAVVEGRAVNGHPIAVRPVGDAAAAEGLHLLFISHAMRARHQELMAEVADQPTLVVTERPGGLGAHGGINLDVEDHRVRFDVDLQAIEARQLRLSAQLLKAARTVRGAP